MEKTEKIVARVIVDRNIWRRLKARAVLENKNLAEYVGNILKKEVESKLESSGEY